MPRTARKAPGGQVYDILNRSVGKLRQFGQQADFDAFLRVMIETHQRIPIRILSCCVLSTHWHFIVWPETDGEATDFFRWLAHTHAMRWKVAHGNETANEHRQGSTVRRGTVGQADGQRARPGAHNPAEGPAAQAERTTRRVKQRAASQFRDCKRSEHGVGQLFSYAFVSDLGWIGILKMPVSSLHSGGPILDGQARNPAEITGVARQ
jgi:hypothetical protein